MIALTIKTDNPEAEIGLYNDTEQLAYEAWQAHRQLAETLHQKITSVVGKNKINGIVVYAGPGSFTGLRIGISVANAQSYGSNVPIVGASGDNWCLDGIKKLMDGQNEQLVLPQYGSLPHTTQPKK